ncbi:hypothetical protein ACJJV6_01660 [Arthrobacter nitrophenolicus]|uniref:hypothetical protein n=1 Tax=Arthrobacter nitrophenolicus TaxID=683150 RepID=UPI0038998C56
MANRRALRPDHEYALVTNIEWEEFEEHFDKRKVELGFCGRPYGTPCAHEHACIRCPMLHVEPRMILRLDELEADLMAGETGRRTKAGRGKSTDWNPRVSPGQTRPGTAATKKR